MSSCQPLARTSAHFPPCFFSTTYTTHLCFEPHRALLYYFRFRGPQIPSMSNSTPTSSPPNTSYNPPSPFEAAEIPTPDTSPDTHGSARSTPLSRESSSDSVPKSQTWGAPPSAAHCLSTAPIELQHMEDERKGKDVSRTTSPSASSQGDMADNEMEAGSSTQPAEQTAPAPPPKKKRTRTLTTPHQAAVLHALLAQVRVNHLLIAATLIGRPRLTLQSRFPTTAMREEVGRSIGLSARKVQVSTVVSGIVYAH